MDVLDTQKTLILWKVFITILVIISVIIGFYPFFEASKKPGKIEVIDGDTIEVGINEAEKTVRLKGIDTPETEAYNTPEEFKGVPKGNWRCLQDWGYRAKDFVQGKVEGSEIILEYRKSFLTVNRGSFGRLIGHLDLNGSDRTLGELLVSKGYARSYGEIYLEEERIARDSSRGLWEACSG